MSEGMNLGRWRGLLSTLEVTGGITPFETEEDIEAFESATKIILPLGFKEYTLVFGSGTIGEELSIHSISRADGDFGLIEYASWSLPNFKETVSFEIESVLSGGSSGNLEHLRFIERVLNHCLPFATTPGAEMFVWHLGTFSEADQSYDIYRLPLDCVGESGRVGRDFFKFVTDFIAELEREDLDELGGQDIVPLPERRRFYRYAPGLYPQRT